MSEERRGIYEILRDIAPRELPVNLGNPSIGNAVPVPFSPANFHHVCGAPARLCFVDGGNNTLFLSPGRAIHMVRLYASLFDGNSRVSEWRYTYVVDSEYDAKASSYHVRIYDLDSSNLFEDEMTVAERIMKDERIKGVGAYVRRIGEWMLARQILEHCDYVVRDGALQTGEREEHLFAEEFFSSLHDDKGVVGLSKTCSLLTDKGYSLVGVVHYLSEQHGISAPWYYNPLARNISTIRGDMYVVKLHPASRYAFRAEVYPEHLAERVFSALVLQSDDPLFPGYPYGLLDADIHARISDEEVKMYRAMVEDTVDDFSELEMNAMNAHDIISEVK